MKLRILDKNNNELFVKQGLKIDCTYESEYSAGDKIYISANNCYFFKIQLDSALKETVVYAPSGSFEYRIPTEVLERIYEEGAFAGTEHAAPLDERAVRALGAEPEPSVVQKDALPFRDGAQHLLRQRDTVLAERDAVGGGGHSRR